MEGLFKVRMVGTKVGTRDRETTKVVGRMVIKAEALEGSEPTLSDRIMATNPRVSKGRLTSRLSRSNRALGQEETNTGRHQARKLK